MQNLHASFFLLAAGLLATADTRGYFCELGPSWVTTLGFSLDELRSQPLLDFVHPEDHGPTQRVFERLLSSAEPALFENRCLCKDGSYKRLRWLCRCPRSSGLILACAHPVASDADAVAGESPPADAPPASADSGPEPGAAPLAPSERTRFEPLAWREMSRSVAAPAATRAQRHGALTHLRRFLRRAPQEPLTRAGSRSGEA